MSQRSEPRLNLRQLGPAPLAFVLICLFILGGLLAAGGFSSYKHRHPDGVLSVILPEDDKEARSTALFLTGPAGWRPADAARAKRLSEMHTMVVALDGLALLTAADGNCAALADRLVGIAQQLQTQTGALSRTPVLVGLDGAGDLALAAAANGGTRRFKGLVTLPQSAFSPLCPPPPLGSKAPVRWLDLAITVASSPARDLAGATVVTPDAGSTTHSAKAFFQSYLSVAGTDSAFDLGTVPSSEQLADLPLTLHYNGEATATGSYAIFLSGDGGWARFDEEVADRLADSGIPVVGISALRYLWQEKRPAQIAADIARIDGHYRSHLKADRFLLVGFSLGANTMPFAARALPAPLRDDLQAVVLLAPETLTGFEIRIGGWLGQATGSMPVPPEIDALAEIFPPQRILCLYGSKESVSACPEVQARIGKHAFDGGHHLAHDHDRIAEIIRKKAATP